jgi:hypothetical protein
MIWVPCGGCLVTEDYTFEAEPNLPPVILSKAGEFAIGDHVWIDKSMLSEWRLQVQVRDENVEQPLEAHWRIVHEGDLTPPFERLPVQVADQPVRELEIFVPTEGLHDYACHSLELAVSGSFQGFTAPMYFDTVLPGDESDVARAKWWIWEGEGEVLTPPANQLEIFNSCITVTVLTAGETIQGGSP